MAKDINSDLFTELLPLGDDWKVADVKLDHQAKTVDVKLYFKDSAVALCPQCGDASSLYDHAPERCWRHLDTMQYSTSLRARVPRVDCADCGVQTIKTPWAEPGTRFTLMFEAHAVGVIEAARSLTQACGLLEIGWSTANRVMERAVERGLERRNLEAVPYVGIDEKSFRKGHRYVSVLNDINRGCVIEVVEGRKEVDADRLWASVPQTVRGSVRGVAMDMWQAFENATRRAVPGADIVHDRFHISSHLNKALGKVKNQEHRQLSSQGDDRLKGSRYLLLRNEENLSDTHHLSFELIRKAGLKTSRAWFIKESFRWFWQQPHGVEGAQEYFDQWYRHTIYSKIEPMKSVARMIKSRIHNLLTWCKHRITNAVSEGINSRIQSVKSAARGFHSFESYRIRILFFCGKLDMLPTQTH